MKSSFVFRLLPIVAFGFLSGCADKDEKVKKGFEKDIVSRFSDSEILEQCGLDGWSDWAYNLEKTDSLISPYLASVSAHYKYGDSNEAKEKRAKAVRDNDFELMMSTILLLEGDIDVRMAYQDDKWVIKKLGWTATGPLRKLLAEDGEGPLPYDIPELNKEGKPEHRWVKFRRLLETE